MKPGRNRQNIFIGSGAFVISFHESGLKRNKLPTNARKDDMTTKRTAQALLLVLDKAATPYRAAKDTGINLTTMYKSRLYKMILAGKRDEVRREVDEILTRN